MKKSVLILSVLALMGCQTGAGALRGSYCVIIPSGYVLSDGELSGKVVNGTTIHRLQACPPAKPLSSEGPSEGGGSSGSANPGRSGSPVVVEGVKVGGGDGAQAIQVTLPSGTSQVTVQTGSFSINADGSITGMRLLGDVR